MPFFCLFLLYFYFCHLIYGCSVDSTKLNSALSNLAKKGYDIVTAKHIFYSNSSSLPFGANPNGVYGVYEIDFYDVDVAPFWYVPGESAIIFHGCSPPNSSYFSYRSYLGTEGQIYDPFPLTFASMGDSINQLVINYTNNNNPNSPFDALITMVTTPDQVTYDDIYSSFESVDLQNTLNLDIVPNTIGNDTFIFGKNTAKSNIFTFIARIAIPFDINAYKKYIDGKYTIYLVSTSKNIIDKINQFAPRTPYTYPVLRNRTSNIDEINLYMDSINALRESVTNYFVETQNMKLMYQTLVKALVCIDGYECIEDNTGCLGDNHDAAYFVTNTSLKKEDFFINNNKLYIGLGINHNIINQTVYSNLAIYAVDNPLLTVSNCTNCMFYKDIAGITNYDNLFYGSAEFFNQNGNITNIDIMFVVAFARPQVCDLYVNKEKIPCLALNESVIGNNDPFGFAARAYLNPNTKTGPSYQQIILDTILEFNIN